MRAVAEGSYANGFILMTKESQRSHAKVATNGIRSTVIGFRKHGFWEFWVQHRETKAVDANTNSIQVRAVQRLQ